MDHAGNQFLAGAGLAEDENRGIRLGHQPHTFEDRPQARIEADDGVIADLLATQPAEERVLLGLGRGPHGGHFAQAAIVFQSGGKGLQQQFHQFDMLAIKSLTALISSWAERKRRAANRELARFIGFERASTVRQLLACQSCPPKSRRIYWRSHGI